MRSIRSYGLACAILWIASVGVWPVSPAEHGPFVVAEPRGHLENVAHDRELDTLVLSPFAVGGTEVPPQGFPLLVFNHGFLLRGDVYRSWGERLASHAFVVAPPTYPMLLFHPAHSALARSVQDVIDRHVARDPMPRVGVPVLFVGAESESSAHVLPPCAPVEENYQGFHEAASLPAMEITQIGAEHGQYVDSGAAAIMTACAPGTAEPESVRSTGAAHLTAFLLGRLRGDGAALEGLDEHLAKE